MQIVITLVNHINVKVYCYFFYCNETINLDIVLGGMGISIVMYFWSK